MTIVFDTNILMRATCSPVGLASDLFDAVLKSAHRIATSPQLLSELSTTLYSPRIREYANLSDASIVEAIEAIASVSHVVDVRSIPRVVPDDPKDDIVIGKDTEVKPLGHAGDSDAPTLKIKSTGGNVVVDGLVQGVQGGGGGANAKGKNGGDVEISAQAKGKAVKGKGKIKGGAPGQGDKGPSMARESAGHGVPDSPRGSGNHHDGIFETALHRNRNDTVAERRSTGVSAAVAGGDAFPMSCVIFPTVAVFVADDIDRFAPAP